MECGVLPAVPSPETAKVSTVRPRGGWWAHLQGLRFEA